MLPVCKGCSCGRDIPHSDANNEIRKERLISSRVTFEACKKLCMDEPGCRGMEYQFKEGESVGNCSRCYNPESHLQPDVPTTTVYKLGISELEPLFGLHPSTSMMRLNEYCLKVFWLKCYNVQQLY